MLPKLLIGCTYSVLNSNGVILNDKNETVKYRIFEIRW